MEGVILFFGVLFAIGMLVGISRMSRAPGRVDAHQQQIQELARRVKRLERDAHIHTK
jgi:hypothetical protein